MGDWHPHPFSVNFGQRKMLFTDLNDDPVVVTVNHVQPVFPGDNRTSAFPFLSPDIPSTLTFVVGYVYIASIVASVKVTSNSYLRPLLLILNGFLFGVNGIGFLIYATSLDLSRSWTPELLDNGLKSDITLIMLYVVFLTKVGGLFQPTGSAYLSVLDVVFFQEVLRSHPSHSTVFLAVIDFFLLAVIYGHRTLTFASWDVFRDRKSEKVISGMTIIHAIIITVHGLYLSQSDNSMVFTIQSLFGLIRLIISLN